MNHFRDIGAWLVGAIDTFSVKKLIVVLTDTSATVGNVTNNSIHGRATVGAGTNTITVTNSLVTADSTAIVIPRNIDATLTSWSVVAGAGNFVLTGNANATANWSFDFVIVS